MNTDDAHEEPRASKTRPCLWCQCLPVEPGDLFCDGCRYAYDRDPRAFMEFFHPGEEPNFR